MGKEKIKILKEHFPSCFMADGSFDLERFQEIIGGQVAVSQEVYELRFLGKSHARMLAAEATKTVLVPDAVHNEKPENRDSGHIYISGDNLDGLKHLLRSHTGKIKCIYIDPPYNTGSGGFVYHDSFSCSVSELAEKLNIGEEHAARILGQTEKRSASHCAWLMFMYPRLQLARELLSSDGVIFISIDDNEYANLKLICDDIFGESNYLNTLAWVSNLTGRQISGAGAVKTWESILVYGKSEAAPALTADVDFVKKKMKDAYKGFQKDIREDEYGPFAVGDTLYNHNRKFNEETRPNLVFSIFYDPVTGDIRTGDIGKKIDGYVELQPHANGDGIHKYHAWRWSRKKIANEKHDLTVLPTARGGYEIYTKIRDFRSTALKDIITNIPNGGAEVKALFGGKAVFEYPKPVDLLKLILRAMNDREMTVLDFFSGSATTAHAVMETNLEKGGNINYILIQATEKVKPGSVAEKEGYQTIDEVGMARIIKAAESLKTSHPDAKIGFGFRHYTIRREENGNAEA